MPLDRKVIDLAWKVSHGALLTMDRLLSFGLASPLLVSVAFISSQLSTCFSIALSPRAASIGSSLSSFVLPLFPLLLCCVTFFLVLVRTRCLSFPGFLSICSTHSNFWFGLSGMIVVFGPLDLELLPFSPLSKPVCVSTSLCSLSVLSRLVVSAIFCASGAPPVSFVLLAVGNLSFISEPFLHISCILGRFSKLFQWFRGVCPVLSPVRSCFRVFNF